MAFEKALRLLSLLLGTAYVMTDASNTISTHSTLYLRHSNFKTPYEVAFLTSRFALSFLSLRLVVSILLIVYFSVGKILDDQILQFMINISLYCLILTKFQHLFTDGTTNQAQSNCSLNA